MKKTTLSTLVVALLVVAAGVAWAGQATVQAPEDPAAEAPAVETPAPEQAPDAELPADGEVELDEATLEALFQDPTETGACCMADCFEQRTACMDACPPYGDPDRAACVDRCWAEYDACKTHC